VTELVAHSATEKLKHPSIIEAVCELRFAKGASYTIIPGALYERIKGQFSDLEVLPTASMMSGVPEEVPLPSVPHHRFKSTNPNALVQTGPRLLTVNVLRPYPNFEEFRRLILYVLEHYKAVAQPGVPMRVGLRYINHLRASAPKLDLSHYLRYRFDYPQELPHPPKEVAVRLVFPYENLGSLGLAIAFPSTVGTLGPGALLDLELAWTQPVGFDLENFPEWLDRAHQVVYLAFTSTVDAQIMAEMRG